MKKTNLTALTIILFASSILAAPNYIITNNTPGFIKKLRTKDRPMPAIKITVSVWLNLHNENQLSQLLTQQTTKGSGQFHKWLSQSRSCHLLAHVAGSERGAEISCPLTTCP